MTIFDPAHSRIIDGGGGHGGGLLRLIGLGVGAFLLVILLFSAVTKVGTGHVGVLTLFGKVQSGETLGEGIHLINPMKTNNELSIQTQTLKESASVPSRLVRDSPGRSNASQIFRPTTRSKSRGFDNFRSMPGELTSSV